MSADTCSGRVLSVLPAGARILDCACGTARAAIALAGLGYEVHGADECPELPWAHESRFDAVFCTGNALAHVLSGAELRRALYGMRSVLRPGGTLVVESRDFPPFRANEFERCLLDVGLDLLDWEWDESGDGYVVIAERPAMPPGDSQPEAEAAPRNILSWLSPVPQCGRRPAEAGPAPSRTSIQTSRSHRRSSSCRL